MSCPHCGFEADPDQEECPLCGTPLGGEAEAPGVEPGGAAHAAGSGGTTPSEARPAPDAAAEGRGPESELTPWEAEGGTGALADSWWESLTDPTRFFSRLDWNGALARPVLYFLVFWILAAGFEAVWFTAVSRALGSAFGLGDVAAAGGAGALSFFLSPFKGLFLLGLAAGALHLSALALAERPRSVRSTVRALCYAAGPQVLRAVPLVGGLAAFLWSGFLAVIGVRSAHRTTTFRAAAAVGIVFFLFVVAVTVYAVFLLTQSGNGLPVPVALPRAG